MRTLIPLIALALLACGDDASVDAGGDATAERDSSRPDVATDAPALDAPALDAEDGSVALFRCTHVIGYSQVGQMDGGWYVTGGAFESEVGDGRWQLRWNGGAGVDRWQMTDYEGWDNPIQSACDESSDAPDRVLLSVSGPFGSDEDAWVTAIEATIAEIRVKHPSAMQIILQPVVGGPDHAACPSGGGDVRASWQHMHIDAAIARVAGGDIIAGMSPEVADCSDYRDSLGHLTPEAAARIGGEIGRYYEALDGR